MPKYCKEQTAMTLQQRLAAIRLVALDVDGVLTDGGIQIGREGELFKRFNVRDGLGIKMLQAAGIEVAIITGRRSTIVEQRCAELGISRVTQGARIKIPAWDRLLEETGLTAVQVAYMGDDVPDLPLLQRAGLAATPADGSVDLDGIVHWRASRNGGHGAVRELAELILKSRGLWDTLVRHTYCEFEA